MKKQRVGSWNSVNYVVRINSKWNVVFLLKFQHGHTKYLLNNIFTQAIFFPLAFYLCACVRPMCYFSWSHMSYRKQRKAHAITISE